MKASSIEVVAGNTRRNLAAGLDLARRVYAEDPDWVPQLAGRYRAAHAPGNPYFSRGVAELFIVYLDGVPAARATAFFDAESSAAVGGSAYFANFECIDDPAVAEHLFEAIAGWAEAKGARALVGPMSPRMAEPRGIRVEGEGAPGFGMAYNPSYYGPLLETLGFGKRQDLLEFVIVGRDYAPRIERIAGLAEARLPSLTLRPLDTTRLDDEMRLLARIYNEAWKDNWGFVPLHAEDMIYAMRPLRPHIRPEHGAIAEIDGDPVGVVLLAPDVNNVIRKIGGRLLPFGWLRIRSLIAHERAYRMLFIGVMPSHRRAGIETLLLRVGSRLEANQVYCGWVLESSGSWVTEIRKLAGPGSRAQRYRIYGRLLGKSET